MREWTDIFDGGIQGHVCRTTQAHGGNGRFARGLELAERPVDSSDDIRIGSNPIISDYFNSHNGSRCRNTYSRAPTHKCNNSSAASLENIRVTVCVANLG